MYDLKLNWNYLMLHLHILIVSYTETKKQISFNWMSKPAEFQGRNWSRQNEQNGWTVDFIYF